MHTWLTEDPKQDSALFMGKAPHIAFVLTNKKVAGTTVAETEYRPAGARWPVLALSGAILVPNCVTMLARPPGYRERVWVRRAALLKVFGVAAGPALTRHIAHRVPKPAWRRSSDRKRYVNPVVDRRS